MSHNIRKCTIDDLEVLQKLSYNTFNNTFGPMNTASTMEAYLESTFNKHKLSNELADGHSAFYFLYSDGQLAGYLKLNEAPAQTDINDPNALEIERIYVVKKFQGQGLGSTLINMAADIASNQGKAFIWLGVWEKNLKALQFYKRHGFYETGKHSFYMGEEEQTDYILRKDL